MRRIAIGLFLSLIATRALADPCHAIPDKGPRPAWAKAGVVVTGTARYIIDGDGLCIGSSSDPERWVEVRLADYYAPELRESGGAAARAALTRLTEARTITCTAVTGDGGRVVSYDRLIAICRIGGVSLADLMHRAGQPDGGRGLKGR
jgi:endonuclease YncB( thermonuclease family)